MLIGMDGVLQIAAHPHWHPPAATSALTASACISMRRTTYTGGSSPDSDHCTNTLLLRDIQVDLHH